MDTTESAAGLTLAAVDLGATSGRVILGGVHDGVLRMKPVARFANVPQLLGESMHWPGSFAFSKGSSRSKKAIERCAAGT